MTKGTFGDNLKREREMRGVSLDEISGATRIATRFLIAIENEQWDQLPGGVFNRGFVRAVARYLGLDEENIVAEYALAVDDRPGVPVWTGSPPVVTPDRTWLIWVVIAVIIVAILAGGWFGTRRIIAWRAARHAARSVNAAPPLTSQSGTLDTSASASAVLGAPSPSETSRVDASSASASNDATQPSAETSSVPADSAPLAAAPDASAASPQATPMELKIETVKKTKVTIQADAKRVFDGTLKAGENYTFSATGRFQVSSHDAGALVLVLNGKTLAPMGPLGHSGSLTLTREALKESAGGGN